MLVEMEKEVDALPDQVHFVSLAGSAGLFLKHERLPAGIRAPSFPRLSLRCGAHLIERQEAIIYFEAKRAQCGGVDPSAVLGPRPERIPASRVLSISPLLGNEQIANRAV